MMIAEPKRDGTAIEDLRDTRALAIQAQASDRRRHERLIRIGEVVHRIGVHRGTIYRWIKQGRFPAQIAIGINSAAWYESQIDEWIANPLGWGRPPFLQT